MPPRDLIIGVSRTVLPHGKPAKRYGAELVTDPQASCRFMPCIVVSNSEINRVYVEMVRLRVMAIQTRRVHRSPHVGSRFLWARWPGSYCSIGTTSHGQIDPARKADFDAISELAWEMARQKSATP